MRRVKGLLGVIVGLMLLFHAGGTTAYADDKGNNGTIKIHEAGTSDSSNENDPHVCNFHINGNGFDKSSSGTWKIEKDPNGKDAEKSGRYPISQFGLKMALQRTLKSWKDAKKDNALNVEYLGVKKIKETDNHKC